MPALNVLRAKTAMSGFGSAPTVRTFKTGFNQDIDYPERVHADHGQDYGMVVNHFQGSPPVLGPTENLSRDARFIMTQPPEAQEALIQAMLSESPRFQAGMEGGRYSPQETAAMFGQPKQATYKAHVAGGQADILELKKLGEAAVTDTPALDILAATKQAGLADFGRNALMAGAIGSAGVAGGMGGQAMGHNLGTHLDPSNPSPAWHAPARQQMAAETHPANTLGMLGGLGGAGGGAGAAALALLAARRRGVPLGAGPVA